MNNLIINNNLSELNPHFLKQLLNQYSKDSDISKWDIGASSSSDISVQVQKGEA